MKKMVIVSCLLQCCFLLHSMQLRKETYQKFSTVYETKTFTILSNQPDNSIEVYPLSDYEPVLVINGNRYDHTLKGVYLLLGKKLYSLMTLQLVTPIPKIA